MKIGITVDGWIHAINRLWVRFACKHMDSHFPIAVYHNGPFSGYECEICGKSLDVDEYSPHFTKGAGFLWQRGLKPKRHG